MPLSIKRTVAPAEEPISLAEAKAHCRIDITADDSLVESLIVAAREYCERYTRRTFVTSTWQLSLDYFPCYYQAIELVNPPIASVTSITYLDGNGDSQTLDADQYVIDTVSEPGRVSVAPNNYWPHASEQVNAITVEYVAGYGNAAAVPAAIKQAMLLIVGHWYENRESVVIGQSPSDVPLAVSSLLKIYRVEGLR